MNKIFLIAKREISERFSNRFFRWLMVLGPLLVLALVYLFLSTSTSGKKDWKVLLMDKESVFDGKLAATKPDNMSFDFINAFVDYDEFAHLDKYQKYDFAVWINEKVVSNKHVIIFYREKLPSNVQREIVYLVERRMEEIMVNQFTDLSVEKFRDIKQSLSFSLKNVYDPRNEESNTASWVGFGFGGLIILFVFMFGMTILRSISREKSNRIVEVLLSSVKARQLMTGKVLGIGFSAFFQFIVWTLIIGFGLYMFRMTVFPDIFSGSFLASQANNADVGNTIVNQSPLVSLIYQEIQYANMLVFFTLFFIGGYLFYGSFFAMIGASMGSESDGQQFVIPINILLFLAVLSGAYVIYYPGILAEWLSFIPFTSPMVMMIRLANGFQDGGTWQIYMALIILFVSAFAMLLIAGRIYKNGILRFNHRLSLKMLFKWVRK